jgi:hypothetical protein
VDQPYLQKLLAFLRGWFARVIAKEFWGATPVKCFSKTLGAFGAELSCRCSAPVRSVILHCGNSEANYAQPHSDAIKVFSVYFRSNLSAAAYLPALRLIDAKNGRLCNKDIALCKCGFRNWRNFFGQFECRLKIAAM